MAYISPQQRESLSIAQISKREALRLAVMFAWMCCVVATYKVGRPSGLHIPGHRTAFWMVPLLLGSWMSGRRHEAGAVGVLAGAAIGLFIDPSFGWIKGSIAMGISGWLVGFCSAPSFGWRGLLKSLAIGLACGFLALGTKLVSLYFDEFRFNIAVVTYPVSGMLGAGLAWALFLGSDQVAKLFHFRSKDSTGAFTLIELLIVVAIIALLAAIAVPNFLEAQTRSKVSRTKSDFAALATAIEAYCTDHMHYPPQGTAGNAWQRLTVLSTPVAYITKAPLEDPFCRERSGDVYYRYSNYMKGEAGANTPEGAEVLRWALRGRAPDGTIERTQDTLLSDGSIAPDSLYDPTNGTVSRGDILRTGGEGTR